MAMAKQEVRKQEVRSPSAWHYVDSKINPADNITQCGTLAELANRS